MEDPGLHADDSVGGLGPGGAIVDICPEGLERYATLGVPLGTRLFGTSKATGAANLDPFGAGLHGALNSLFHGATEGEAPLELLGDSLGHQGTVGIGVRDFLNVHCRGAFDDAVEFDPQRLDRLPAAADDHARFGGMDGDVDIRPGPLDFDTGDSGVTDVGQHGPADDVVFGQ